MGYKMTSFKCPNCGASLHFEDGKREATCLNCGESIVIEKDNEFTFFKIDDYGKNRTDVEIKKIESEERKVEYSYKKEKDEQQRGIRITVILIICLGLCMAPLLIWSSIYKTTPIDARHCRGENYTKIVRQFKDAGFARIELIAKEDLKDGMIFKATDKVDTVESISINGDSDFKKGKEYNKNAVITIYYHVYPQSDSK